MCTRCSTPPSCATFARVVGMPPLDRYFFIEGGALAVENALKTAMDWKVRKNLAAGRGERGTEIMHFERAFHGRSGYTMSLTNTDPRKIAYFAKFPWPRIVSPSLDFSLPPALREAAAIQKEKLALKQIRAVLAQKAADIAAIIIEPIQGEGGDNHFRGEFLQALRRICDEHGTSCSSLTKSSAAWALPVGTGAANISMCCPTCWSSARKPRSAASWPGRGWTR